MARDFKNETTLLFVLKVVSEACRPRNYRILMLLPAQTSELADVVDVSRGTIYNRLHDLNEYELIVWSRGVGLVELSEAGKIIMKVISELYEMS